MTAGISLVTLGVRDLARSEAFYLAMGWERSTASVEGEVAFLRSGPVVLSLYGREALAADAGVAPTDLAEPPAAISLARNLPTEQAVDEACARAEAAGGRIVTAPGPVEWGGYLGYVADPDGHLWEFTHNPGFPLADDGTLTLPDEV